MPIEIKITDISTLNEAEITALFRLLTASSNTSMDAYVVDSVVKAKKALHEVCPPSGSEEFNAAFANHAEVKEEERDETLSANLDGTISYKSPPLKSRKKRKSASSVDKAPEGYALVASETVPVEKLAETINKYADAPPPPPLPRAGSILLDDFTWQTTQPSSDDNVTYEDVVAFVLEITRTKKADYQAAMLVIQKFGLMNLNALAEAPQLISPLYKALKELVNE